MPPERIHPGPRMTQAVIHNGTVYLAGQVASGARRGTVAAQTTDILAKIDTLLAEAGSARNHILSATIWLTDMETFSQMNEVWDAWVVPGATPARATVGVPALASPDFNVEIAIIAAQLT